MHRATRRFNTRSGFRLHDSQGRAGLTDRRLVWGRDLGAGTQFSRPLSSPKGFWEQGEL